MGIRSRIGLAIACTAALVAVLVGLLVHHRAGRAQLDSAREVLDTRLQDAVQDHAAGVDHYRTLVNPPDLPPRLWAAVQTGRRATYLDNGRDGRDGRSGQDAWPEGYGGHGAGPAGHGAGQGGHAAGSGGESPPGRGADGRPAGPPGKAAQTGPTLWAATKLGDDVIAVRRDYGREARALRDLDRVLWLAGGLGTGVASVVGLLVAAGLGRRLTVSADTAQRIAEGDLTARLPTRGKDEIDRLTAAVNTMADALAARLQAEREVTANIAHELRTPVAGLVAAAELLPPSRPSELVRDRAQRVRALVEDVLEVARLDSRAEWPETEPVLLSALARRAVGAAGAGDDPGVRVRVTADALAETDARRVERVLANLVSNALRHGAAPVTVEVAAPVIRVRDAGPGFPEDLLAHGPQRFRSGARDRQGLGLGLTIAMGQARVLGARLTFANPEGGGAEAVLDLGNAVEIDDTPAP
ncbi:sensor histidine kinase [Streptomyces sp. URMC 123]|uniref:sensor histidine kinase n=1 Tax=Streptomyces sp. URMC 123 TaxID=3423403 RepID=UPI003F1A1CB2